ALRVWATTDSPLYPAFVAKANKYGHGTYTGTTAFGSYGYSLVIGHTLEVAGANPTRASLEAGIEGIRNYDNGIALPQSYGPGQHVGTRAAFPAKCCHSDYTWQSLGPAKADF